MKLVIVGTGYVGLVSGTCFAEMGIKTICVDIDEHKINNLNKGIVPIWEPGLTDMVKRNQANGSLNFSTDISESLQEATFCFIAVGTPPFEDGSADVQNVLAVARTIGKSINSYIVVVVKSTVPIGTSSLIKQIIDEELHKRNLAIEFDIVSNPEFLKEGDAIKDCLHPDRIVIGSNSKRSKDLLEKLYRPFVLNGHPIVHMDLASAELTKYAANAMLATKISFMNDLANFCEKVGADITSVRQGIGSDKRIGHHFIYAGIGYGGSCFPKDVKAIISSANEKDYSLEILKAVEKVNEKQKLVLFNKAMKLFNGDLKNKKFAIWGLSFKPNTDDIREAPSLVLIDKLLGQGAVVNVTDPVAIEEVRKVLGDKVNYFNNPYEAVQDVDAMFLVTEWTDYRFLNYKLLENMKSKIIFDGRNIYMPEELRDNGFKYFSIGRPNK